MPKINSRVGGSEWPADHAHGIVYSRDASSAFILGKRASAIAASAAGRRRGNGRGGRRSNDIGRRRRASGKGTDKAGATGSAQKAGKHQSQRLLISPLVRYPISMGKRCTVTITDGEGKRYSLDVNAGSSYDAAHLFVTHVRNNPSCGLPIPTTSTQFDVVTDGRIYRVPGTRLKKWIENRRSEWKGRVAFCSAIGR
jgi:hypothetical protein